MTITVKPPKYPITVSTGHEGSADCCFVITCSGTGASKEFLIESDSWQNTANCVHGMTLPVQFNNQHGMYNVLHLLLRERNTSADERVEPKPSHNMAPKSNAADTSELLDALFELYLSAPAPSATNVRYQKATDAAVNALDSWGLIGE